MLITFLEAKTLGVDLKRMNTHLKWHHCMSSTTIRLLKDLNMLLERTLIPISVGRITNCQQKR